MSEHLTDSALEQFQQSRLGSGLSSADQHLGGCPDCRARLDRLAPASDSGLLAAVRAETRRHLTYDQIEGLHERTLPGEEATAARDHIAICRSCREEFDDFSTFADEFAKPVAQRARPRVHDASTLFDRIEVWLRGPNLAVAGVTLIAVLGVWLGARVVLDPSSGSRLELALATVNSGTFAPDRAFRISATLEERVPRGSTRPESLRDVAPGPVSGLSNPVGEAVVGTTPSFEWSSEDPPPYRVEIFDRAGTIVTGSAPLEDMAWDVTLGLEPDQIYSWHVVKGNGPTGMAEFKVISSDEADLWAEVLADNPDQPLLLGAIAQDLGLLTEARSFYSLEIQEDPDSELAARLLEGTQAQ
jgi:hypothetical protein